MFLNLLSRVKHQREKIMSGIVASLELTVTLEGRFLSF